MEGKKIKISFQVVEFGVSQLQNNESFNSYIGEIADKFCPYISPSEKNDLIKYTLVGLESSNKEEAESTIFFAAYLLTLLFRQRRSSSANPFLVCENLVFKLPKSIESEVEEMISWPHWILKSSFTEVGVMFGKFWKNEDGTSRKGRDIDKPTESFISIRSAIKSIDPYFFSKAPELIDVLKKSYDDGKRVQVIGENLGDKTYEAINNFLISPSSDLFFKALILINDVDLYKEIKSKAQLALKA